MLFTFIFWLISAAYGEKPDHEIIVRPSNVAIYIDQDPSSKKLSKLISTYARMHRGTVRYTMTKAVAPGIFEGKIKVYDQTNIKYRNDSKCDYNADAIKCGIENKHWTIVSSITIEQLHANFNLSLFDEEGVEIATSSVPVWGFIQLLPRYKKTTVTENSMFGKVQREILEQYPPKRKEIPPLITSKHVSDAIMMLYLAIEVENI